jgi:hypothetical protein
MIAPAFPWAPELLKEQADYFAAGPVGEAEVALLARITDHAQGTTSPVACGREYPKQNLAAPEVGYAQLRPVQSEFGEGRQLVRGELGPP